MVFDTKVHRNTYASFQKMHSLVFSIFTRQFFMNRLIQYVGQVLLLGRLTWHTWPWKKRAISARTSWCDDWEVWEIRMHYANPWELSTWYDWNVSTLKSPPFYTPSPKKEGPRWYHPLNFKLNCWRLQWRLRLQTKHIAEDITISKVLGYLLFRSHEFYVHSSCMQFIVVVKKRLRSTSWYFVTGFWIAIFKPAFIAFRKF